MKLDYCPVCKRDIYEPERPFDTKVDNHIGRCHYEKGFPKELPDRSMPLYIKGRI